MLSFAGDVKLIDFGIARSAVDEAVTNLGVVVGRRSYVPPEAWDGTRVDGRARRLRAGRGPLGGAWPGGAPRRRRSRRSAIRAS